MELPGDSESGEYSSLTLRDFVAAAFLKFQHVFVSRHGASGADSTSPVAVAK